MFLFSVMHLIIQMLFFPSLQVFGFLFFLPLWFPRLTSQLLVLYHQHASSPFQPSLKLSFLFRSLFPLIFGFLLFPSALLQSFSALQLSFFPALLLSSSILQLPFFSFPLQSFSALLVSFSLLLLFSWLSSFSFFLAPQSLSLPQSFLSRALSLPLL